MPAAPCASTCSYPSAVSSPIAQSISRRPRSRVSVSTTSTCRERPLSCSWCLATDKRSWIHDLVR
eukprot:5135464-Prymnesium_polylepis.1